MNGPHRLWAYGITVFGTIRAYAGCDRLMLTLFLRYFTYPNEPNIAYPEGFQGTSIPVHGPTVAKLIENRLEGGLHHID